MAVIALAAGALLAGDLSAAPPSTKEKLQAKQAQAQSVLAQVNTLDQRFEASVEAWNGAKYELGLTEKQLKRDRATLARAEKQRRVAEARVEARVVQLYQSDTDPSVISILLGSDNLTDALDRLDAAHAVAAADHQLAVQTTAARNRYEAALERTRSVERQRAAEVSQLDTQRRKIGALLAQRKRMLASVQSQVTQLQAQEAREQAKLAAEARARLRAEQAAAAARAKAAAKAAAAAAAAQAQQQQQTATDPTTTAPDPGTTTDPTAAAPTSADPTSTAPTTTAAAPTAPLPPGHPEAASIALKYLGVKYQWGGATPAGFDCSGLVMYVYAQLGIILPHYAAAQYGLGVPVPKSELQPGDLVFFDNLDHVGIYIGGGDMVHAPQTGDVVKIEAISDFGNRYVGARRL